MKSLINIPSFLRTALQGNKAISLTGADIGSNNSSSTSSFIYDPSESSIKSTQQLNVDWSKFEEHCFFTPAAVNVNCAFDRIINGYPFDGTRIEIERFYENLTGFENWVLSQFPKYRGQLLFDTSNGSYISVADAPGSLFPDLAKTTNDGMSVISPLKDESFTIEFHYYPPYETNDNQYIVKKIEQGTLGPVGFTLFVSASSSTSGAMLHFLVSSSSYAVETSASLEKGTFNHILAEYVNEKEQSVRLTVGTLTNETETKHTCIGTLDTPNTFLTIGSGSSMTWGTSGVFVPQTTLSGVLDEFRIFKSIRDQDDIKRFETKSIFARDDLVLCFRFNEPAPPLVASSTDPINSIVLDSSGNSLHSLITNFTSSMRVNSSGSVYGDPMSLERETFSPILFPSHTDVVALSTELLESASLYDDQNPNIVTRLVPNHYFLEGQVQEGLTTEDGTIVDTYTSTSIPGSGKLGQAQLLMSLLYVYSRFFDDMKLYVDSFSTTQYVDYDKINTVPDTFLQKLLVQKGFVIPPIFSHSTIEQYVDAENVQYPVSAGLNSLKYVQNELLRRLLTNLPSIVRSKGTQASIRAFLRTLGIDPDNSCKIREYGGMSKTSLGQTREVKREIGAMVDLETNSIVASPYLSSSRREVGFPAPAGTMVDPLTYPPHGISNNVNDGILTSGSWTVEAIVKFPQNRTGSLTGADSIIRLCTSGTYSGSMSMSIGLVANLVALTGTSNLTLHMRPGADAADPIMTLNLSGSNVYTGDTWNVCFGRSRNDELNSIVSSSYFVRAARNMNGSIVEYYSTSSYFQESLTSSCVLSQFVAGVNDKGLYLALGKQSIPSGSTTSYRLLNNTSVAASSQTRETNFTGLESNLRFWSRALSELEWKEHVRNYKSCGVIDPLTEYNFVYAPTGSFGRLRIDTLTKQDVTESSKIGSITFIDYSGNEMHLSGGYFSQSTSVFSSQVFDVSYISPTFDEPTCDDKIRPRSFLDQKNIDENPRSSYAPVYTIEPSEEPNDDVRLSIDFSLVDALNRDIVTIFSTLDAIDNAIGDPALLFSPDYPDLERMRTMYFNRLSGKLDFKAFHEFFKFFDMSLSTFIEQLIPKKTKFRGLNFMIEPHMLERHKIQYFFSDMYLGDSERQNLESSLLLQQIEGLTRKY